MRNKNVIGHPDMHRLHGGRCECVAIADELGIKWPDTPWDCPECERVIGDEHYLAAFVDVSFVRMAKKIIERGKKELARPKIQPAVRAEVELSMHLSEAVVQNPASFLCLDCALRDAANGLAAQILIDTFRTAGGRA
jgi:hypothetical protein